VRALAVAVRVLLVLLAVLFGAAAGTVALLGTATITVWPPLFLLAVPKIGDQPAHCPGRGRIRLV
jgi:hypothetical protein